jgi:tRNA dimethylallyltransferase
LDSQFVKYHTLVVIVGPTAVGKTSLSIQLAKALDTEIVSADSRQIFREMNVGTAKPSEEELQTVKHHFINSHSVTEDYDAATYGDEALQVIQQIFSTRQFAILCGGSGLYIKAVCEGFDDIPEIPQEVRNDLIKNYEASGIWYLQNLMEQLDPDLFKQIDRSNPHRLIRALEVKIATGVSISTFRKKNTREHNFNIIKIGLELPREILNERIDRRMDEMIANGLFDEAKSLYRFKEKNALQTVGYQEIFDWMDGQYDYEEAVRLLKRNSRRYAKRQMTWFKRDHDVHWFLPNQFNEILALINQQKA